MSARRLISGDILEHAGPAAALRLVPKLLLLPAFIWPGWATLLCAGLALPPVVLALRRETRTAVRLEHLLTGAAFLFLLLHHLPPALGGTRQKDLAETAISRALEERLRDDARLLEETAQQMGPALTPSDPAGAFEFLEGRFRRARLEGRGLKLYDQDGALVAWYGETLDPAAGARRVALPLLEARTDLVLDGNTAGVVLRVRANGWGLVLEDAWLRRSPIEALGLQRSGWLAEVERRHSVRVLFETEAPVSGDAASPQDAARLESTPLRLQGQTVARLVWLPPPRRGDAGSPWLRIAAACALAGFLVLLREAWGAVERRRRPADGGATQGSPGGDREEPARARGPRAPTRGIPDGGRWIAQLLEKAGLLILFRWGLEAGAFLETLLPGTLSSPLAFASRALGPFTSSPADLLVTSVLLALLALDAFRSLIDRSEGAAPGSGMEQARAVVWRSHPGWPILTLLCLVLAGFLLRGQLLQAGSLLIRDTSTQLLFRPNLYSTPEGIFLFVGFASLAAAFMFGAATIFTVVKQLADRRGGPSAAPSSAPPAALPASTPSAAVPASARLAYGSLGLALLLGLAMAAHLHRSAPDVSGSQLATALWALGICGGLGVAGLVHLPELAGGLWIRRLLPATLVVGLLAGLLVVTAHGAGRIWGLRQFMAERLDQVGLPSNQWLEYNLRITGERLSGSPAVRQVLRANAEAAAFVIWTSTPLRDLPFPSALLLVDREGQPLSRFSLLPPEDHELLPRIARASIRADTGQLGRAQTPGGRSLIFTAVPAVAAEHGALHAVAVVSEALEPPILDETPDYFLRDIFSAEEGEPFLFAIHRGDPVAPVGRALTLASGRGPERIWMSVPLGPYLPDALDYLSLCLTTLAGAFVFLLLYRAVFGSEPMRRPGWSNPLATFRGRIFTVLLAFVALPIVIYSWVSFQTTRHEIEQATEFLSEESLRAAAAFLGPRLEAGGAAEIEAVLPEAARVVGRDLTVYRGGHVQASSRPEIFLAHLFSRRIPGELYRRLAFGGERLVTQQSMVGKREVLVAYLRTPWSAGGVPYILASPLLLRDYHIKRDQRELLQVLFSLFGISLLALGGFSWLVSRQLTSPLSALKEGADRIARGDLAYRLQDPERSDEFSRLFSAFNTMAAGLQVSQGELLSEKTRVQAILSSVGAGVVALDRDGRVQLVTERARELLGLPASVIGRHCRELPPAAFWERAARALRLGQRREDELQLARGDELRTLHLTFTPLLGETGERRGLVGVFEDISGLVAAQRSRAWEEMARQVAHEIKNPLTPIQLSLQHLRKLLPKAPSDFPAILERNLNLVLSEIGRLERIAGEFSRFGADRVPAQPMEAEPTLREVVELYRQQDDALRFELAVRGQPTQVLAERDGLKKVLVNLFENAREAMNGARGREERPPGGSDGSNGRASQGRVQVVLDYEARPEQVLLSVRDEGPGIPPADLERLFQPYFSTKTGGTGLGLAIARRLVESWGGNIEARNWERGAEVLLWLGKSASPT